MFRAVELERASTETGGGVRRSWSRDLVEEGRLHRRAEGRRGGEVVEEERFGKRSTIGVGDGSGEVGRVTGLGDVNCGAKLKGKKV